MTHNIRMQYADALAGVLDEWTRMPGDSGQFVGRTVHAVMGVRDAEVERLRARLAAYERAMPPPGRLELLADWFDSFDADHGDGGGREVQQDLRRWAAAIRAARENRGPEIHGEARTGLTPTRDTRPAL